MPEWVRNKTNEPIPRPCKFTPDQDRLLHDLQRRKHLENWDERTKKMPLTDEEVQILGLLEAVIDESRLVMHRGVELRFAPSEMVEVPDGAADAIVARMPERLEKLTWREVRSMDGLDGLRRIKFQTAAEAKQLIVDSAGKGTATNFHKDPVDISIEDGMLQYGDSRPLPMPAEWNKPFAKA